ncbi:MAG: ABC transporter ATP-binding protein [Holosporales bacterium]|jgi:multiple sugar transport system ATP-binding protein|nr:ABC transporter ATP-binding protein [Holosporales bacterium]
MSSIKIDCVSKSFKDSHILKDVNLDIEDGKCTVLVGPSGCGKSTLLRLICGLETVDSGNIYIDNELVNNVPPAYRSIAMVFQSYALYPHMSVFDNMAFALRVHKISKKDTKEHVMRAAKILKIEELLDRFPRQLSGGQRQRVAIGRAIVRKPKAFLFDEPLSNLDAALRTEMRYEIAALKSQLNVTMVYVTHDQAEAMTLADTLVVMNKGRIEQSGKPLQLYNNPKNTFVASFIGAPKMNFIEGTLQSNGAGKEARFVTFDCQELSCPVFAGNASNVGKSFEIGVRPENITIVSKHEANCLKGTISWIENLGNEVYLYSKLANGQLVNSRVRADFSQSIGDTVFLHLDMTHAHIFDHLGNNALN